MTHRIPGLFLALLVAAPFVGGLASAQLVSPAISILPAEPARTALKITPDRADWTYQLGASARFHISFDLTPYPEAGVPIKYKLGPETMEGAEQEAVVPAAGLTLPVTGLTEPGFVRCLVAARLDGKLVRDLATIGFAPESITPTQKDPADFDAFWTQQKATLAKIPPDYRLTPAPDLSTPEVEVSYLSFQNIGGWSGPSRFYGVLSVPRGAGPFPAVFNPPGAGIRPYGGMRGLAAKGVITLQVGIHGIPVNLPSEVYDQLGRGALSNYPSFNLDDRNAYYYRRVYLGCLRSLDYLASHPKWDGKHLIAMGGSQGGQLSLVATALDSRVTGVAASYPAYSDVTGYLHGRAGGWPGFFRWGNDGEPGNALLDAKVRTTGYYDAVNFARRVKVPGFYFWGYNDDVCPPTSIFAAYNIITAPKQVTLALEQGHTTSPSQQARIEEWVLSQVRP
jgi:cephalosporin-C deacetylase